MATDVHVTLNDPTVKAYHDRVALQQHQQRRRVVWLTPGGTTEPPKQGGGRLPTDGTAFRVQACRVRVEQVHAHIFAETRELTEQLLDNLIAAVCSTLGVVEIPTYAWVTEERDQAGTVLRAAECILRINLRLPVPEQIKPLTPVIGVEDVCGTLDDDGNTVPQGG
jgi:hypothetical protein